MSILGVGLIQGLTALAREADHSQGRLTAAMLASDLREEILSKSVRDPDQPPVFGREPGEYGPVRMYLDDRDDYLDLSDRPAADLKGNPIPGVEDYSRTVEIRRVSESDPSTAAGAAPSRLYRYSVTVQKAGAEVYRLEWLDAVP